jgi:hypothetical protein
VECDETAHDFEQLLPMPEHRWNDEVRALGGGVECARRGYGRTERLRYCFFTSYDAPIAFLEELASRGRDAEMDLELKVELLGLRFVAQRRTPALTTTAVPTEA